MDMTTWEAVNGLALLSSGVSAFAGMCSIGVGEALGVDTGKKVAGAFLALTAVSMTALCYSHCQIYPVKVEGKTAAAQVVLSEKTQADLNTKNASEAPQESPTVYVSGHRNAYTPFVLNQGRVRA